MENPILSGTITHISKETLRRMDMESVRQLLLTVKNLIVSTCEGMQCYDCPYSDGTRCFKNEVEIIILNIMRNEEWKKEFQPKPERNEP